MALQVGSRPIRRGLPRVHGGAPWPEAADVPVLRRVAGATPAAAAAAPGVVSDIADLDTTGTDATGVEATDAVASVEAPVPTEAAVASAATAGGAAPTGAVTGRAPSRVRRGLPRVRGGESWPSESFAAAVLGAAPSGTAAEVAGAASVARTAGAASAPQAGTADATGADSVPAAVSPAPAPTAAGPAPSSAAEPAAMPARFRRGLPRTHGGDPWPPLPDAAALAAAGAVAASVAAAPAATAIAATELVATEAAATEPAATEPPTEPAATAVTPSPETNPPVAPAAATAASVAAAVAPNEPSGSAPAAASPVAPTSAPATPAAQPTTPAKPAARPAAEPKLYRGLTLTQWVWRSVGVFVGAVVVVGILILAARGLFTFQIVRDFVKTYPGDYPLPKGAPVGFPGWLSWQHFLNAFFIVLIIRSGIQVRREQRPKASWTPRWNPGRKISLTLWLHQSLDLLWVINGVVFLVLLFSTGQWMRVIPTSWSVFPNAITAALNYASLQWPTDDGWVNYNSLQQLAYFVTIFIAAPLAAVTGLRMSGLWPKKAERLSKLYPVEVARAIHFPVMIYFVAFIVVHVALVFATGALRNLNHMYGGSDEVNWVGFWIFVASLVVMAAGWVAARPLVIAPIASLFGRVGR
ncbi:cytochrome b/b6 domain-containing protein [Planctomonas sp. JC2975]|uniref:cytochrome b/b6 domain-containing protein n=1 Tax=Planctomonas sp. JC2975 TaxID=2729626 RepID=UPI00147396A7|nr:cytochrome b/b6 domain-containing protein [Planctomonas sp. JC2975]NNC12057.1 cytochrome b/b6 domain-containing protein [Planctomonas sp. JC2975]